MNKEFKKKKYLVVKRVLSPDILSFLQSYLSLKRKVAQSLFEKRYISPFESMFGRWDDKQIPNTYSHYGDIAMETLLAGLRETVEKYTGLELYPNYSYVRIYKKADMLHRHKDRFSCEISTTLHIGGDPWPICIDPDENNGIVARESYQPGNAKGVQINLKPGDMLIYQGGLLEHWREPFQGDNCYQVFLHYNNIKTSGSEENKYDKRPHLGLPANID